MERKGGGDVVVGVGMGGDVGAVFVVGWWGK